MPEEGFIEKGKKYVSDLVEKVVPIPSSDTSVHNGITKSSTKKATLKVLAGTLTVEGNPMLKPNEIVTIENVAKRHSGNWLTEKVTHDISAGGTYTCTVDVVKNGTQKETSSKKQTTNKNQNVSNTKGDKKVEGKKKISVVYVDVNGGGKERKVYK